MRALCERVRELVCGRKTVVLGVGNRLHGDDGVGSHVAEALRARTQAPVFDVETVPENFLAALLAARPDIVLIVDAVDHGARPGTCCVVPASELPVRCGPTTTLSVCLLARALESQGIACWLVGIQPESTTAGGSLSPAVAAGAHAVEETLVEALGAATSAGT